MKNIQQAVERTAGALANAHASVGSINEADSNLRAVLEQQTAELDEIALRAGNVAGATPQQQALPAVDYLIRQGRKRFLCSAPIPSIRDDQRHPEILSARARR